MVFGRPIQDFIPIVPGCYKPRAIFSDVMNQRESVLKERHDRLNKCWAEHTKVLPKLEVGDHVFIQNQVGHHATKWDKSGVVVEVLASWR